VLRRIFGFKTDEVPGEWRKLHNEGLNDLYSLNNNVIKLRRIGGAGHVALMEVSRGVDRILVGNLRKRDHLGYPGVDGRIILRSKFKKWNVGYGLDRTGLG